MSRYSPALALTAALMACDPAILDFRDDSSFARGATPATTTFLVGALTMHHDLVSVGDLDGDGIDDAVLAGGDTWVPASGEAMVLYGEAGWPASVDLGAVASRLVFPQAGPSQVRPAGDLDGDGYDDLVIGESGAGGHWPGNRGRVFVVRGGPTRLTSGPIGDRAVVFEDPSRPVGTMVVAAGDLDGSGAPDLLFAEHHLTGGGGSLFVFFDPVLPAVGAAVPLSDADLVVQGDRILNLAVVDMDGDGANELVVTDELGGVEVRAGTDPGGPALWRVAQKPGDASFYATQVSTVDRTGDGVADLAIADMQYQYDQEIGYAVGAVYGFDSGPVRTGTLTYDDADWLLPGRSLYESLGSNVAVGPPDSDAAGLVLVGIPTEHEHRGVTYLLDPTTSLGSAVQTFRGGRRTGPWNHRCSDRAGTLTALGDFDGDGATDALVYAPTDGDCVTLVRFYSAIVP